MIVCDSSDQAKKLFEIFISKYNPKQITSKPVAEFSAAAEPPVEYISYRKQVNKNLSASLILHDIGTKEFRDQEVRDFKDGKIDFLFVYNMLLTGFDAKRLKKLYIGRVIKDHNLLQTLTRVNRPYKDFKFGFVVDFADIRKEFDATNRAYFEELQMELGDEWQNYSNLFKSKEEIEADIRDIKEKLFHYDLLNAEIFSQQISLIEDRQKMLEINKALSNAKDLYNIIRMLGHYELLEKVDFRKLNELFNESTRHLQLLNLKESIQHNVDNTNLLNVALENVIFMFRKVSEEELIIADQLKDILRKAREGLGSNFDQKDLDEISQEQMKKNIGYLRQIYESVTELNRKNNLLRAKYENDAKYARTHKRIWERGDISKRESEICETLIDIKRQADEKVLINTKLLNNESYFEKMMIQVVIESFMKSKIKLEPNTAKFINSCLVKEYINEYQGIYLW
jgi:type I restriction enzyme R subunit